MLDQTEVRKLVHKLAEEKLEGSSSGWTGMETVLRRIRHEAISGNIEAARLFLEMGGWYDPQPLPIQPIEFKAKPEIDPLWLARVMAVGE